jgi:hypothetical protein
MVQSFLAVNDLYERLIPGAHGMLCALDGRIVSWTAGAAETYGWAEEQAVGSTSQRLLETEFPTPLTLIKQQLECKGLWSGELIRKCKCGKRIVVHSLWRTMVGQDGQTYVIEVNKRAGDVARSAFGVDPQPPLQDTLQYGVWDWDVVTNTSVCSEEWLLHHGHRVEPPPSYQTWLTWVSTLDRLQLVKLLSAAADTGSSFTTRYRVIGLGGETHLVQTWIHSILNPAGECVRIIAVTMELAANKLLTLRSDSPALSTQDSLNSSLLP